MRYYRIALILIITLTPLLAQEQAGGPISDKARKSYQQALGDVNDHMMTAALESFKKADKQDGGRCKACQAQIIKCGVKLGEWKAVDAAAQEMVEEAQGAKELAMTHVHYGVLLMDEGLARHKQEPFERAHAEMTTALKLDADSPVAVYNDGLALAHMEQDDAAKAQFERFVKMKGADDADRRRALFYISHPEMARAKMSPPFNVTTADGRHISLDDLRGKVVLVDFWATWCGPCRAALPHIQNIARKFQGQPLVILSVSMDADEHAWKNFIAKNGMTWLNCRDGRFDGPMAEMFDVHAIPHTFTIDADGVLQDEEVGDAAIEGKLKKQIARAREVQTAAKAPE